MTKLILGSTSRYRRDLLERLRLPFEVVAPEVDESPLEGESPAELAPRLALAKASEVASRFPHAVVIGADQVAELDGRPLGKPGHFEAARGQLMRLSGREAVFHTALALLTPGGTHPRIETAPVRVRFRRLDEAQIERYLRLDEPYDCAGSARCETLGITLLEAIESDDPTALIGLPLIRLSAMLRDAGLDPLASG